MHYEIDESEFDGWRTRGYLPHCDRPRKRQFITYRMDDALPVSVLRERDLHELPEDHPRVQELLDVGHGSCALRQRECAEIVVDNWKHHDGTLYVLRDYVVMPNHVHVEIDQLAPLKRILHAWKSYTGNRLNELLGRDGRRFWQVEYFDRYVRDERHDFAVRAYIYTNPVRAGLVDDPFEWEFSSIHRYPEAMKPKIMQWFREWNRKYEEKRR